MWNYITYHFTNFNGFIEVWEWMSDFIPHVIMDVIIIHAVMKVNPYK